ncbi:proteasome regulatory particle base subunit [Naganishia albida]|nr:proteasome regulatory particle base subunit [Naganishia albida]
MSQDDIPTETIAVPAKDPEQDEKKLKEPKHASEKELADGKAGKEDEISEEDLQLKNELEMLVERIKEPNTELYTPSLESLRTLIKTSTSSMTSVPKPLKFLRRFYDELIGVWESRDEKLQDEKSLLASIISVLAMTYSDNGHRDTLHYRIVSKSRESPGSWGNEYVRHLAAELGEEYNLLIREQAGMTDAAETQGEAAINPEKPTAIPSIVESKETAVSGGAESVPAPTTGLQVSPANRPLKTRQQLLDLALELVPFFLAHNAEADAVDLLLEVESIESLVDEGFLEGKKGEDIYARVCQYMISCVPLLVAPDDKEFLRAAAAIYALHGKFPEALALAVRLRDRALVRKYFEGPKNPIMRKQLAFFLARAQIPVSWVHCSDPDSYVVPEEATAEPATSPRKSSVSSSAANSILATPPPELDDDLLECLGNQKLSEHFKRFGKELDVFDPKSLEDIYKSHLDNTRGPANIDSARANLAGVFVNAFVNAGFGNDKLMVDVEEGQSYIYKNKDHGMMSATASLGMSMLWDTEMGVSQVDKYSYSAEEHIKAGALLATGILHNGVRAELDVAYALLEEHVDNKSVPLKCAAMNGIAIASVGQQRTDIVEKLLPYVLDETSSMEVAATAALSLGFIFAGSGAGDIAGDIVQAIMERDEKDLNEKWARFMGVALGLIFLGKQDESDPTIQLLRAIEHPIGKQCEILVQTCSYAATGNVLLVQEMLHHCTDHAEKPEEKEADKSATDGAAQPGDASAAPAADTEEKEKEKVAQDMTYQAFAVIGIALIAMGEEVGAAMCLRQFNHLMAYGDPVVRKAVPLALGLISASNPQLSILETLSRYSHDNDLEVAINAILAMGMIGAGTNNARLAQMLRQLAVYYNKEPNCLFMVRVAQGLVHMGKGTIGINPFFADRNVLSPSAVAGLLSLLVSFADAKSFVLDKSHWMLYWIVTAMYPQFLITLNEQLEEQPVTVRVGQAVNTVGLAGQRMGISGFQTHQTPVRVAVGERAEFGTNEWFPYGQLEGIVIVKKNESYDAEDMQL